MDKIVLKDDNIKKLEENFELLSPYETVLDKITAKCKVCGYEDTKTARTFLRSGCSNCRKIARAELKKEKLKEEDLEYLTRVNADNDEYEITKYRETKDDYLVIRHNCGKEFRVDNKYSKVVCDVCHPEQLIDAEWYRDKYEQVVVDGYGVLGVEYGDYSKSRGRTTTIKLKHKECGLEYDRNSLTFKEPDGHLCPVCTEGKRLGELNEKTLDAIIKNLLGDDYEYAGGYNGSTEPFKVRHKACRTVYTKRLSTIRVGSGYCPVCVNKYKVDRNARGIKKATKK